MPIPGWSCAARPLRGQRLGEDSTSRSSCISPRSACPDRLSKSTVIRSLPLVSANGLAAEVAAHSGGQPAPTAWMLTAGVMLEEIYAAGRAADRVATSSACPAFEGSLNDLGWWAASLRPAV